MTTNTDLHVAMPELPEPAGAIDVDKGPYTGPGADLPHMYGARVTDVADAYSADQMREYARAAIQQAAVPEGMQLVPIDPTPEMVTAGREVFGEHVEDTDSDYRRIYRGFLAASPAPPKQQPALGRGEGGGVPLTYTQKRHLLASLDGSVAMGWLGDDEADELKALLIPAPRPSAPTGQINPDSAGQGMEIADSRCDYMMFKGQICNKCGQLHDGGSAPANQTKEGPA